MAVRPEIVVLVPVPVVLISPGNRVIVQVPPEGKPSNITLPVGIAHVGCVIVPISGAPGVGGCSGITTSDEGSEVQPAELVTVKV